MDERVRQFVRERAGDRCEYCQLPQSVGALIRFHIEHVLPRQHGGGDAVDNLALACPNCNWHKGPNLASVDPASGQVVELFNPRRQRWDEHFELRGPMILGLTPNGRVTVQLLRFNTADRVEVRSEIESSSEG